MSGQSIVVPHWAKKGSGGGASSAVAPPGGGGGAVSGALADTQLAPRGLGKTTGILPFSFGFVNLGSGVTALQAYRIIPDAAHLGVQLPVPMVYRGSIVAVMFRSTAAMTAGAAFFEVYVGGSPLGAKAQWSVGQSKGKGQWAPGTYVFPEDAEVDLRATTSGFAPTTADVEAIVFCTFEPE